MDKAQGLFMVISIAIPVVLVIILYLIVRVFKIKDKKKDKDPIERMIHYGESPGGDVHKNM